MPDNWQAHIGEGGLLEFAPASWLVPGFWEDYYDGDPTAAEIVKTELSKIVGMQRDPGMPDLIAPMTSLELQAAAEQLVAARGTDPWKGLMLVLLHFTKELPVAMELSDVLASVDAYWGAGKGTPETLQAANRKCQAFLKELEMPTRLDNPEATFASALLCVLEPLGDEESRCNTAAWFAGIVWDIW
ncbi:hypothetical protein CVCC1112_1561 [Paenarthrobacter nicotinovorans]|uniref:hypothetical protein n=1 Tax=Paenarthrobacter nicotinovorans TaxID=29320 RepID=UPI0007CCDDC5|nr:hypothetical protein [Paenarthrobacter nicotinovorans]GAT86902.1 hypothetical protein CVCC1112_1561 [Paenarthrobacter nicotinovorans]